MNLVGFVLSADICLLHKSESEWSLGLVLLFSARLRASVTAAGLAFDVDYSRTAPA